MAYLTYNNQYLQLSSKYLTSSVYDADGNAYTTIKIGTQEWMVGNLKTTKYRDRSSIPNISNDALWHKDTTGAYCWYNNDISYKEPYGALYNWYAVTNLHGLAPLGWRIATYDDLLTLQAYLGGSSTAGSKLKESGTEHWIDPNTGTNESLFTAVGGGCRGHIFGFHYFKETARLITSTAYDDTYVWAGNLYYVYHTFQISHAIGLDYRKNSGLSVRCIRE